MKKITILSLHLGYGGIEKAVVNLANSLCNDYEVEIVSTYKLFDKAPFKINKKIKVNYLITKYKPNREEWKDALKKFRLIKFIKQTYISLVVLFERRRTTVKAIKNSDADIIISTRTLFNKWLGKYGSSNIKKIAWEHNHHHGNQKYAMSLVSSCKNIDNLVLVSEELRKDYRRIMRRKNIKCKCVYIPNSLDNIPEKISELSEKKLISVGRMSREKGFPDLIEMFKELHDEDESIKLDIVGDGPQKNMVVDMLYEYDLCDCVKFHGFRDKEYIDKLLSKSSLYVMTSYTESFGIVLIEAMSHGVPCIAYDSAEGANDLIENDKNGYLIENRDKIKMKDQIIKLLKNEKKLKTLGKNARSTSLNYSSDIVKEDWIKLLEKR